MGASGRKIAFRVMYAILAISIAVMFGSMIAIHIKAGVGLFARFDPAIYETAPYLLQAGAYGGCAGILVCCLLRNVLYVIYKQ